MEFHANDIEKVIFNESNFLDQKSFSTTHQSVNVYSEVNHLYEVRCEDKAVDIIVADKSE